MAKHKVFDLEFLINLDGEDVLYNQVSDQFNDITRGFYASANLELLKQLRLNPQTRILDLACGTGHLAIEIAKKVPQGKVTGVDMSPQMLTKAKADAQQAGVTNMEFIERNIHEFLPGIQPGDYQVGVSCFALSYLGCDFLLKEFRALLGPQGQIGITTSSTNSLSEWQPLFMEFIMEHMDVVAQFNITEIPDLPSGEEDMLERMKNAGIVNPKVKAIQIPLIFEDSQEAASYLISAGWLSNYFFRVKDKAIRRHFLEWSLKRVDEHHRNDPHISANIEFLVAWNEP